MDKVRINLANPSELYEIPGLRADQRDAIIRFRAEHGPIESAEQLSAIVGGLSQEACSHLDFEPASVTAPEAPGA